VQLNPTASVQSNIMKTAASLLCLAVALSLIGCTTTTETTTTRTTAATADSRTGATPIDQNRNINKRTYTQRDIQSTGRGDNVGEALSTLDAGVFVSGGGG
jgi:hypothetical protein